MAANQPIPPPSNRRLRGLYKHGHSARGNRTPVYLCWKGMLKRCHCPGTPTYASRRGLVVCDRWRHDFAAFLADMGPKPGPGFTVERIDNDRGYSCGKCEDCKRRGESANCRWATYRQQGRNTRVNHLITFRGETRCLIEWEELLGMPRGVLKGRIHRGWTVTRAFTQPVRKSPLRK